MKKLALVISLIAILISVYAYTEPAVIFNMIDVGQGDSLLINLTDGENFMIDSGDVFAQQAVVKFLKKFGVKKLDYVLITHPHTDHYGALKGVLEATRLPVGKFYYYKETKLISYRKMKAYLKKIGAKFEKLYAGKIIKFADGTYFEVFNPPQDEQESENLYGKNFNNYSIVGKLVHGKMSIMLTGDAEKEAEHYILEHTDYSKLKSVLLKVGHHGSRTSSTREFLEAVNPKIALISVGKDNEFGHPAPSTVERLKEMVGLVYMTENRGDISVIMWTDGKFKILFGDDDNIMDGPRIIEKNGIKYLYWLTRFASDTRIYLNRKKVYSDSVLKVRHYVPLILIPAFCFGNEVTVSSRNVNGKYMSKKILLPVDEKPAVNIMMTKQLLNTVSYIVSPVDIYIDNQKLQAVSKVKDLKIFKWKPQNEGLHVASVDLKGNKIDFTINVIRPVIGIDALHRNMYLSSMKKFVEFFSNAGFKVEFMKNPNMIYNYDLFVIQNPAKRYLSKELTTLSRYINAGILIFGASDYRNLGKVYNLNEILKVLKADILFNDDSLLYKKQDGGVAYYFEVNKFHPILFKGCDLTINVSNSSSLIINSSKILIPVKLPNGVFQYDADKQGDLVKEDIIVNQALNLSKSKPIFVSGYPILADKFFTRADNSKYLLRISQIMLDYLQKKRLSKILKNLKTFY